MRPRRATALAALAAAACAPVAVASLATGDGGQARAAAASRASATAFATTAGARGSVAVAGAGRRTTSVTLSGGELSGHGTAAARAGASTAAGEARAVRISVFDGLVTASALRWRAAAANGHGSSGGRITGLVVAGSRIGTLEGSARFPAGGYGTAIALESTGLTVRLTKAYKRWPAGTTVSVGLARARAPKPAARPTPTPKPKAAPAPAAPKPAAKAKRKPKPAARKAPPKAKVKPVKPHPKPKLTDSQYTFPVLSKQARPCDCFGAAREIGAHQGDDIFAPFGTPVVAVHAGRLNRVGTLPISGNRLWVKAPGGDSFFYAHLSAFSPAAVSGAWVKAGTVLGYVGNTGDAEPTPPHLHFEIHPRDGKAVDPYAFLTAWRAEKDVARGAWDADTTSRPGTLVQVRDFLAR
jgi:murein DD-endopeptidase MepM/ murein hydrolase activator NlpD